MPDRPGNWQLLNRPKDPIGADPARVTELAAYYAEMAETISTEAAALKRIGDGDDSRFKGKSADALRKRSHDVAESLGKASGRYVAVGEALRGYQPELEHALSESARALADAESAENQRASSVALADPSANRPADAPPLTEQETKDVARRTAAISEAADAAAAARARLDAALAALNDAGKRANSVIRAAWHDGLTDTLGYKIAQFFKKFLKILVKVLMWIGIALSVLAFFVPGLGALALAGAITSVISLAASTALAAMGEGSWLDVILGVVSVVLIGAGGVVAKLVQNSHIALLGKIGANAARATSVTKYAAKIDVKRAAIFKSALNGKMPITVAMRRVNKLDKKLVSSQTRSYKKIMDPIRADFKVKPQFWNIRHPDYLKNDLGKIKDVLKGDYKWDRLLSVDRALKLKDLQGLAGASHGIAGLTQPAWHFANGGRVIAGWLVNVHKIASYPPSPYHDSLSDSKGHLMTGAPA